MRAAVPRHLIATICKCNAVHSHGNAPQGGKQSWAPEKLRVTTQTDLHLGTDPRPEELPLPHARSASAVPPVQPVLWVLVVPPHWGRGAQPASRLIPGSAGSRRPTPQRTDAGAAQPPRALHPDPLPLGRRRLPDAAPSAQESREPGTAHLDTCRPPGLRRFGAASTCCPSAAARPTSRPHWLPDFTPRPTAPH